MSLNNQQNPESTDILYTTFNQDYSCFACGTTSGFRIFNVSPYSEIFRRSFASGGIGIIEMLYRCNIIALVGGGSCPRFPTNTVMIWDDNKMRCIAELKFNSDIRAVKLRRDKIVVVLDSKISVYNLMDVKLLDTLCTSYNPNGIVALCPNINNYVLAFPGDEIGQIKIISTERQIPLVIQAHNTPLQCLALSSDGTRLASASEKGTIIRIYDTSTGQILEELRRGKEKATMYSIAFSSTGEYLACTSSRNTLHVYKLKEGACTNSSVDTTTAEKSKFKLSKYLNNSLCKYPFTDPGRFICGFSADNKYIVVLTSKGTINHITYQNNTCHCEYAGKYADQLDAPSSLLS